MGKQNYGFIQFLTNKGFSVRLSFVKSEQAQPSTFLFPGSWVPQNLVLIKVQSFPTDPL